MRVAGFTIIGDFLRPDAQGNPGSMDRPVAWLHNALKRQLHRASNLPVDLLTPTTAPDLRRYARSFATPAQAEIFWAANYQRHPESETLHRTYLQKLEGQFCIGYELPPYITGMLDAHAIPYLDLRLHPIRFLDDLIFAARASHPATQSTLHDIAVSESEILITAGLREAMARFTSDACVPRNTLIVLGQRPNDSSQIINGSFFDAANHRAEIHALCARHAAVVLKPHPHDKHHSLLIEAAGAPANVLGVINDNIYRMLALPEITGVLTVNSSTAYEAAYFGKQITNLAALPLHLAWRDTPANAHSHIALNDVVLSVDFWRTVLSPHVDVTAPDGVRLPAKPNRLRIALDSFWNFQEIDTDRIPRG